MQQARGAEGGEVREVARVGEALQYASAAARQPGSSAVLPSPREGWDHAEAWLPHAISSTGLEPRFITAELTLAEVTPAMAGLIPLAAESLAAAEQAIDGLWSPASALA